MALLIGRYDKAISAYKKCLEFSDNNDLLAATSYWLCMTYKKIGNPEPAKSILEPISNKMEMVENDAYLDLFLLFKGEKSTDELMIQGFSRRWSYRSYNGLWHWELVSAARRH